MAADRSVFSMDLRLTTRLIDSINIGNVGIIDGVVLVTAPVEHDVLTGTGDPVLARVNPKTGEILWQLTSQELGFDLNHRGAGIFSGITANGELILRSGDWNTFVTLNVITGQVLREVPAEEQLLNPLEQLFPEVPLFTNRILAHCGADVVVDVTLVNDGAVNTDRFIRVYSITNGNPELIEEFENLDWFSGELWVEMEARGRRIQQGGLGCFNDGDRLMHHRNDLIERRGELSWQTEVRNATFIAANDDYVVISANEHLTLLDSRDGSIALSIPVSETAGDSDRFFTPIFLGSSMWILQEVGNRDVLLEIGLP